MKEASTRRERERGAEQTLSPKKKSAALHSTLHIASLRVSLLCSAAPARSKSSYASALIRCG